MFFKKLSKWILRAFSFFWLAFGLLTIIVVDLLGGVLMMFAGLLIAPAIISIIKNQASKIKTYMLIIVSILIALAGVASVLKSMDRVPYTDWAEIDEDSFRATDPLLEDYLPTDQ
ncbi:MAG: hypothetical protein ACTIJH_09595 [Moraxellaceae bacterium]